MTTITADLAGLAPLWHLVPAEQAHELRVAMAIIAERSRLLDELAVQAEDVDGGGLLMTFPVDWGTWTSVLHYNGDDETEARVQLGRGRVSGLLGAAAMFNPQRAAAPNRPS